MDLVISTGSLAALDLGSTLSDAEGVHVGTYRGKVEDTATPVCRNEPCTHASQVTSHKSQVTGRRLQVIGRRLQVIGRR